MGNIVLYKGDITAIECDAIVNAANKSLLGGGGVDGAIHKAAGQKLLEECRTLGGCGTGEAKMTNGHNLKAKYVIHTVGPIYSGVPEDKSNLTNCYINSLNVARKNDIHSIAFPAISTGVYGYPHEEAAGIAIKAIKKWIGENEDYLIDIILVSFNEITYNLYKNYLDLC